jgi:hypothetical protein
MTTHKALLGAAIIAVLSLADAPQAHASRGPFESSPSIRVGRLATGLLLANALTFGAIDLAYFGLERPMPIGLIIVQIAVAGVLVPATAARVGLGDVGIQLGAAISSAWFVGHGIYSAAAISEYNRERAEALEAERTQRLLNCAKGLEPALFCRRWQ